MSPPLETKAAPASTAGHLDESATVDNSFLALAGLDQAALDALPQAIYLCADDGRLVRYNRKAAEMWGRTPIQGDPRERFCGSLRLYSTDGTRLPHDQCPMAIALATGDSFEDQEVVIERPDGQRVTALVNIAAIRDESGRVNGAVNCFQNISTRKKAEEQQHHLLQELRHRIKNTLATVHSVAATTARGASSLDEFTSSFEARLLALGRAHALLSDDQGAGAKLIDILKHQLEPFAEGETLRVLIEGPDVDLQPQLAFTLGMIIHELMTNAAKYGSLSVSEGKVRVAWQLSANADGDQTLALEWLESGGPLVRAPEKAGFGTRLIERTIVGLNGKADLRFEPSGLQLQASIPLCDETG